MDYTGTHPQVEAPLNAVYGVTVAATTYTLKAVLDPDLPMNHGFYRAVEIHAPKRTLVNPEPPAPVSAGNVETSQRIVDTLLKTLAQAAPGRVPAASQGTMNNILIGGYTHEHGAWVYYETIAGGAGATPWGDGADAVHTHMTNTLNTPVEVIEREYPLMVLEYRLREDSCGAGKHRGGLGVVRAYKLLRGKATLTIQATRTRTRPWGLAGGQPGAPGEHLVVKKNGKTIRLDPPCSIELEEGDIVIVKTPGGGGYGPPSQRPVEKVLEDLHDQKITIEYAKRHGMPLTR